MLEFLLEQEFKIFNEWVDLVGVGQQGGSVDTNRAYSAVRKAYVAGAIAISPATSLIQEVSAFNYWTTIDGVKEKVLLGTQMPAIVAKANVTIAANIGRIEKAMAEPMSHSVLIKERVRSAQIERDIGEGTTEAEARRNIRELTKRKTSRKLKGLVRTETGFAPLTFFDRIAILSTWNIAKAHVEMQGVYEIGSKEYWADVVDKAETAIRQTQPTFVATDKSEILNNPIAKEITMFSSQRSKLTNMTIRALYKIKRGRVADGLADLAYVGLFVSTAVVMIKRLVKLLRGELDEDDLLEDVGEDIAASYVSNLPVAGLALESAIKGQRIRPQGVILGDLQTAVDLYKALESGEEKKLKKAGLKVLQASGVPVKAGQVGEIGVNLFKEITGE